jgi:beta-galactosidase
MHSAAWSEDRMTDNIDSASLSSDSPAGRNRSTDHRSWPSRRQMLRTAGVGLGAAALAPVLGAPARAAVRGTQAEAPQPQPGTRSFDFDPDWKFVLVNAEDVTDPAGAYTQAYEPGFDDSRWQAVDLPHDWSIHLAPVDAPYTESYNGFLPGGLGWYRKTFTLPRWMTGKRISVEFDGVYENSYVYANGKLLGNHPYGYTGFNYDLTGLVHTDGATPNVIAVQASNKIPSSRWYSGSGIYRNVHLVVTDPVHIARHGTFVTTPDLSGTIGSGYGNVQVRTSVQNDGATAGTAVVTVQVRDSHGVVAGTGTSTVNVAAGQTTETTSVIRVNRPSLWSVDDPALYSVETSVTTSAGTRDSTTTAFGFRYFSFDPAGGFSLNGRPVKIQGVDLHATQGPLGAVIYPGALRRQMQIMKSYGANALRTAHNPPAPELREVCEQLGVLMMVEAFDCWHTGKVSYDYHLYFDQWSDADIKEMAEAHKNSPAVIMWSIGNETPDTGLPDGPPIAQRLIADVKSVDATRPVVMGSDRYRNVPAAGSPPDQIVRMLDGLGVNYNTAMSMDALHAKYGSTFFFCSEISSETSTRGEYQDPELINTGPNYTPGRQSTSSYDNNMASWAMSGEYELKKARDRQFWQGSFLWSGQDYIGEPTPYDVFPVKSSFFGAVDTAGFAKDAYHLYRSQWTGPPMVHIVPMQWTSWTAGQPVSVWVYANVPAVELFLNGRSLGTKSFDRKVTTFGLQYLETSEPTHDDFNYPSGSYTSPNGSMGKLHLTWEVPFEPGTLVAVASENGSEVVRDTLVTAGPPHALALSPDTRTLAADGTSVSFVTVSVVDEHGTVVPDAGNVITFRVTGAGTLAGDDNGREESPAGYTTPVMAAFNGQALAIVKSTRQPGAITLTATSPGLRAAATGLVSAPAQGAAPSIAGTGGGAAAAAAAPGGQAAANGSAPAADASFSGAPDTLPSAMLDGNPGTHWSSYYSVPATANLLPVSSSHTSEWVSVSWPQPQRFGQLKVSFVTGGPLSLPASITVTYWNGRELVPVQNLQTGWAAASGQPTTLTFDPVTTPQVRITMTSPSPGTSAGFLAIADLQAATS